MSDPRFHLRGGRGVAGRSIAATAGRSRPKATTLRGRETNRPPNAGAATRPRTRSATQARAVPPRRNPPRDWAAPPPWATGAGASSGAGAAGTSSRDPSRSRAQKGLRHRRRSSPTPRRTGSRVAPPTAGRRRIVRRPAARGAGRCAASDAWTPAQPRPSPGTDAELADSSARPPDPRPSLCPAGVRGRSGPGAVRGRPAANGPADRAQHTPVRRGSGCAAMRPIRRSRHARGSPACRASPCWLPRSALPRSPCSSSRRSSTGRRDRGIGGGPGAGSESRARAALERPPPPRRPLAPTPRVYVVKPGDTLSKIAKRFGLTIDVLIAANQETIKDPNKIAIGDQVIIPVPELEGAAPRVPRERRPASTAPAAAP